MGTGIAELKGRPDGLFSMQSSNSGVALGTEHAMVKSTLASTMHSLALFAPSRDLRISDEGSLRDQGVY